MSRQNFLFTLYSNGLLTSREVSNLLESCKRLKESPVRILRSLRFFSSEDLQSFLNKFCFVPMITAEVIENLKDELRFFLPQDLAQVYSCFAFAKVKNTLHVAVEDPLDRGVYSYLRFFTNCDIVLYSASVDQLSKGLRQLYQLEQNSLKIFTLLEPDWFNQIQNPVKIAGDEETDSDFSLDSPVFQAKSGAQEGFDASALDFDLGLLKKLIGEVQTKGRAAFPTANSHHALQSSSVKTAFGKPQLSLDATKMTQNFFEDEEVTSAKEVPFAQTIDVLEEQEPPGPRDTFLSAEVLNTFKADLIGDLSDFENETKDFFEDIAVSEDSQGVESGETEQNNSMESAEFQSPVSENPKDGDIDGESSEAEINAEEFSAGSDLGLDDEGMFGETDLNRDSGTLLGSAMETAMLTQEDTISILEDSVPVPRLVRSTLQNLSKILALKSLGLREFDVRLEFCNQKLKEIGLELVPQSPQICKLNSKEVLGEEDKLNLTQDLVPTLRRMFGDINF